MATRGTIAKLNPDGTVTSIYVHWDSYPDGVGATLAEHYTDTAKIRQLLALGDISFLREQIGEQHDFNNPTEGWTLAYGRDRGETGIYALPHMDIDGWLALRQGSGCEYGYLWNGTSWETYRITSSALSMLVNSDTIPSNSISVVESGRMKLRYEVYGFTDEEGGEAKHSLLATYAHFADAMHAAELSTMATQVIDSETDAVLWDWDKDKQWNEEIA